MKILLQIKTPEKLAEKKEIQHTTELCVNKISKQNQQPVYFSNFFYENFTINIPEEKVIFESGVIYSAEEMKKISILSIDEKINVHEIKTLFQAEIDQVKNNEVDEFANFQNIVKNLINERQA